MLLFATDSHLELLRVTVKGLPKETFKVVTWHDDSWSVCLDDGSAIGGCLEHFVAPPKEQPETLFKDIS